MSVFVHTQGIKTVHAGGGSKNGKGFQRDGTSKLFGTKGQKSLHCPGTKGQRDKLKILPGTRQAGTAKIRDGPGQPNSGTGRGTKRDRAEKDVLKWENDVLKQKMMF